MHIKLLILYICGVNISTFALYFFKIGIDLGEQRMIFEDKTFIARKIRYARKKAGITQEELSERIGITSKQLSRIEIATYIPSLPTFLRIIQELKIDLKEFGIEEKEHSNPIREEFIKMIYDSTDTELEFCYKMMKTILENANLLRR